jgi:hypothetical protein
MDAFTAEARQVTEALLPEVEVLGIDETRRGKTKWEQDPETGKWQLVHDRWHTGLVDALGAGGLFGQVEGRTIADVSACLWSVQARRPQRVRLPQRRQPAPTHTLCHDPTSPRVPSHRSSLKTRVLGMAGKTFPHRCLMHAQNIRFLVPHVVALAVVRSFPQQSNAVEEGKCLHRLIFVCGSAREVTAASTHRRVW